MRRQPPDSTRLPAPTHPRMPSGITETFRYPSSTASRAAAWLDVHLRLVQ